MPTPRTRLLVLVVVLVVLGIGIGVLHPVDREGLRDLLGGWGVPGFVVVSGVLGAALVPGALLAAAAGLIFGTGVGFLAGLGAALLTSVLTVALARGAGRPGVEELEDRRIKLIEAVLRRRPVPGVVLARLLPVVPDAPCSYVFGLAGLTIFQVVVGTAIGAAPRAFSYAVLGDAAGSGDGGTAIAGAVALTATGVLGAALGWLAWRDVRAPAPQGKG